jgi:hypothetical protein
MSVYELMGIPSTKEVSSWVKISINSHPACPATPSSAAGVSEISVS